MWQAHPLFKHFGGGRVTPKLPSSFLLDVKNPDGTPLGPAELVVLVQQLSRSKFAGLALS